MVLSIKLKLAGSLMKTKLSRSACIGSVVEVEETGIRPEYRSISCELRALAKMVSQEFGDGCLGNISTANGSNSNRSPLFERGRFYEEYSARRNERLKRKKTGDEKKPTAYDLGVRVQSAKRRDTKKFESVRRTMPCTPLTEKREAPSSRYSLRSAASKENKKPPVPTSIEQSAGFGTKKTGIRRARKN